MVDWQTRDRLPPEARELYDELRKPIPKEVEATNTLVAMIKRNPEQFGKTNVGAQFILGLHRKDPKLAADFLYNFATLSRGYVLDDTEQEVLRDVIENHWKPPTPENLVSHKSAAKASMQPVALGRSVTRRAVLGGIVGGAVGLTAGWSFTNDDLGELEQLVDEAQEYIRIMKVPENERTNEEASFLEENKDKRTDYTMALEANRAASADDIYKYITGSAGALAGGTIAHRVDKTGKTRLRKVSGCASRTTRFIEENYNHLLATRFEGSGITMPDEIKPMREMTPKDYKEMGADNPLAREVLANIKNAHSSGMGMM